MRWAISLAILAFAAAVLPAAAVAAGTQGREREDAWPMAGRTPSHGATADGPLPPYRVAWDTQLEGGPPVAAPVLGGGSVVVVGRSEVAALDADSGAPSWTVERAEGTGGAAAIAGELVLIPEGEGETAAVHAVDRGSGDTSWRTTVDGPAPGGVTVAGDRAYLGTRAGTVYALDVEDGSVAWTFPHEGEESRQRFESAPAVADGRVFVTGQDFAQQTGAVYALDADTGERAWSFRPEGRALGFSSASVADGAVVVGTGEARPHARALDASDGGERWATPLRVQFGSRQIPVASDGTIVMSDGGGHIFRIDAESGDERWVFRVPGLMSGGSPSVSGRTVLAGDSGGQLSAIDLELGVLVWKRTFGDDRIHPVAVSEDRIFLAGRGGVVAALEHDPTGMLIEEPSPTTLFLGRALLNFAAAFLLVGGALVGLFWLPALRRS